MPQLTFGEPRSGIFDVFYGWDTSEEISMDVPADPTTQSGLLELDEGEWIKRDDNNSALVVGLGEKPELAFPVVTGKERSDYKGSGSVTVRMGPGYQGRTDHYDPAGTYAAGVKLTIKGVAFNGAVSRGVLSPAVGADPVHAICLSAPKLYLQADDKMVYPGDTLPAPRDQLGNSAKSVIEFQTVR